MASIITTTEFIITTAIILFGNDVFILLASTPKVLNVNDIITFPIARNNEKKNSQVTQLTSFSLKKHLSRITIATAQKTVLNVIAKLDETSIRTQSEKVTINPNTKIHIRAYPAINLTRNLVL
jgi:hypothetical protein